MILKWLQITSDCHQIVCHTEEPLEAELKWDHENKVRVECCFNSRPPSISGMCPKKFQFNNNANGSNLLHNNCYSTYKQEWACQKFHPLIGHYP